MMELLSEQKELLKDKLSMSIKMIKCLEPLIPRQLFKLSETEIHLDKSKI
jgi:hypothetical protein